jgi:hypothetical protein
MVKEELVYAVSSFATTRATNERTSIAMKVIIIKKISLCPSESACELSLRHLLRRTLSSASPIQKYDRALATPLNIDTTGCSMCEMLYSLPSSTWYTLIFPVLRTGRLVALHGW